MVEATKHGQGGIVVGNNLWRHFPLPFAHHGQGARAVSLTQQGVYQRGHLVLMTVCHLPYIIVGIDLGVGQASVGETLHNVGVQALHVHTYFRFQAIGGGDAIQQAFEHKMRFQICHIIHVHGRSHIQRPGFIGIYEELEYQQVALEQHVLAGKGQGHAFARLLHGKGRVGGDAAYVQCFPFVLASAGKSLHIPPQAHILLAHAVRAVEHPMLQYVGHIERFFAQNSL